VYEQFWTDCQDCFVFGMEKHFEISIKKMHNAPADWTIRAFEPRGMLQTKHFLINMPDKSAKQTICVMPDIEEKPETAAECLKASKFWIINGQHSVAASKSMVEDDLDEPILKHFRTWNCYIVWSKNKEKLRRISAYFNRVNHFSVFRPTWATNVLHARSVWENLGKPQPKHTATGVRGQRGTGRRTPIQVKNDQNFEVWTCY
jgi:hypothetical protein